MKINQFADSLNGVANQVPASNKQSATRTRGNDASAAASVNGNAKLPTDVNSLATQVRQLQSQLIQPGNGDFNAAKVAEIRQAISEGRYQVNTDKIADGLLDTVRDLLGKSAEPGR